MGGSPDEQSCGGLVGRRLPGELGGELSEELRRDGELSEKFRNLSESCSSSLMFIASVLRGRLRTRDDE